MMLWPLHGLLHPEELCAAMDSVALNNAGRMLIGLWRNFWLRVLLEFAEGILTHKNQEHPESK